MLAQCVLYPEMCARRWPLCKKQQRQVVTWRPSWKRMVGQETNLEKATPTAPTQGKCFVINLRTEGYHDATLVARFMGPTWGPSGADRTQVGPILAPLTLLSGQLCVNGGTIVCRNGVEVQTITSHKTGMWLHMMTSSNGNIFRVTGHLCGEFTGPRWIPRTKASNAELWCFLWSASHQTVE